MSRRRQGCDERVQFRHVRSNSDALSLARSERLSQRVSALSSSRSLTVCFGLPVCFVLQPASVGQHHHPVRDGCRVPRGCLFHAAQEHEAVEQRAATAANRRIPSLRSRDWRSPASSAGCSDLVTFLRSPFAAAPRAGAPLRGASCSLLSPPLLPLSTFAGLFTP